MSRPRLSLEQLVLRPGFAEAMSWLDAPYLGTGATLPQLLERGWKRLGKTRKLASVVLLHRLRRLEREGLVEFLRFPFDSRDVDLKTWKGAGKGRPPSGRWILTPAGKEFKEARLSLTLAKDAIDALQSCPSDRMHPPIVAAPTILLANIEPIREDVVGAHRMVGGPSNGLVRPARQVALQEWARNPRLIPDWKSLHTLREKHPKVVNQEFSIPDLLDLKPWHPDVRRAHRRLERHRLLIVMDVNPASWDDLPIEQLQAMRSEYLAQRRIRERAVARAAKLREAATKGAKTPE